MSPYFEFAASRLTGFTELCGIRLETLELGFCRCVMELEDKLLNPQGAVHGGAIATIMDVATGTAAIFNSDPPRLGVTRTADVHYLRPVLAGPIRAEARVVRAGKSFAYVRVELLDGQDRLCADGSFEYFYTAPLPG